MAAMENQTDYNEKIEAIRQIPDKKAQRPYIPINIYLQEAENLYLWAWPDKDKLIAGGLVEDILADLPKRAAACRTAQALWNREYRFRSEIHQEWKEKCRAAFTFRSHLLHTFRYAFRDHPDLLIQLRLNAGKKTQAGLIQSLNNLAVLGKSNTQLLGAILFDLNELDHAKKQSDELASELARITTLRKRVKTEKQIRDKAYTYLKEAVDEIRRCGRYVFWHDKNRLKGYSSKHIRRTRGKRKRMPAQQSPVENANQASDSEIKQV